MPSSLRVPSSPTPHDSRLWRLFAERCLIEETTNEAEEIRLFELKAKGVKFPRLPEQRSCGMEAT